MKTKIFSSANKLYQQTSIKAICNGTMRAEFFIRQRRQMPRAADFLGGQIMAKLLLLFRKYANFLLNIKRILYATMKRAFSAFRSLLESLTLFKPMSKIGIKMIHN